MEAEALLNHSMLVLSPFESFECKGTPNDSTKSHNGMDGKEVGIFSAQGKLSYVHGVVNRVCPVLIFRLEQVFHSLSGSKANLYSLFRSNCVTIFHCDRGTHWYNNYSRWFGMSEGMKDLSVPGYELPYGFLYEPWYIGHRYGQPK